MRMKKSICLVLIAAMLAGVLGACGQQNPDSQQSQPAATESAGGTTAGTEVKKVKNLVIGTTTPNNTFNIVTQTDIFGRINYTGFVRGNFIYEAEDGTL